MKNKPKNLWQPREFAAKAGVSVRTLHHYDRLGILKPHRRSIKGFRFYSEAEFARLQQILTLKFIGFSLEQIKKILGTKSFALAETLQLQRQILKAQADRISAALKAIDRAEQVNRQNGSIDWEPFYKIVEVIDMEQNWEWTRKYYSESALEKVEERKKLWSPELQERVTKDWNDLVKDVEHAMANEVKPEDDEAQILAGRWNALIEEFTGGDSEIREGLNRMYGDEKNWQTSWKKPYSDEVANFISAASAARRAR